MNVTTVEVGGGREEYSLLNVGKTVPTVHLAGPGETGGTGPCLCGFDRFAKDENGEYKYGFSIGGGVTGPGAKHRLCYQCITVAENANRGGTHAQLFTDALTGVTDVHGQVWVLSEDGLFRRNPDEQGLCRETLDTV